MILMPNPYAFITDPFGLPELESTEVRIFVPKYNSPTKRADATGAFHPGAIAFCRIHSIPQENIHYIDNRKSKPHMRKELLETMERVGSRVSTWIFFCHGYTHGIQFGLRSSNHPRITPEEEQDFQRFCEIISNSHPAPLIALYACSTGDDPDDDPDAAPGSGDGCFADLLRDNICKKYGVFCGVWAHTTAGHSYYNPNLKFFFGNGSTEGDIGGEMLFARGTKEFKKIAKALPKNLDGLGFYWARFIFIPVKNIRESFKDPE